MSRYAGFFGGMLLALALAGPASAGLYNTADSPEDTRLNRDFLGRRGFSEVLGDLRSIGAPNPERESALRKRYILMEIGNKGGFDLPTLEEKLNYSVVLIRRGRADDAIVLLTPLTRQYPDNLILHSHFATAHFLSANAADHAKAAGLMRDCLEIWKEDWKDLSEPQQAFLKKYGWGEGLYEQNRKYERYLHELMKLRRKAPPGLALDDLFGPKDKPLRFDAAKYEAGRIPSSEKDKLPGDAIEIVETLLVWMPTDPRLFWQLAEIYNATAMSRRDPLDKYNDIKAAFSIMKEMTGGFSGLPRKDMPKELLDHFAVLEHYVKTTPQPEPSAPELKRMVDTNDKDGDGTPTPDATNWRPIIVAFLCGLALGLFMLWQYQEMRRRRQARA